MSNTQNKTTGNLPEQKGFVMAKGDNDTKERKYFDGEEILKEKFEYKVLTTYKTEHTGSQNIDIINKYIEKKYLKNISFFTIYKKEKYISKVEESRSYYNQFDREFDKEVTKSQGNEYPEDFIPDDLDKSFLYLITVDSYLETLYFIGQKFNNYSSLSFKNTTLENILFEDIKTDIIFDKKTELKNVVFINCNTEKIKKTLTDDQKGNVFFDDKNKKNEFLRKQELENHLIKEEALRLLNENKKQEQIIEKEKLQDQMESENGILQLKKDFEKEENWWFGGFSILFISELLLAYFVLLGKNIDFFLIPFSLLLFSTLYFCIYQYSRAKKLRIENQNKIALIDGYVALDADKKREEKWKYFLPNFADIVFSKAIPDKNEKNLPLDEIMKIKSLFKD